MRDILESYTSPELKRMIRASNIGNYSKLKKEGLIDLMLRAENVDRFKDIQPKSKRLPDTSNLKLANLQRQLNREFKKKSKAYQKKQEFKEDSKIIGEKMEKLRERIKKKKPVEKIKPLTTPPERKKRQYNKKPKKPIKGQTKFSKSDGIVSFD